MNTTLAITISPPNRCKGSKLKNPLRYMFDEDCAQMMSFFKYNRIKSFIIYPELDDKGRLHYHGIIKLDLNQFVRFHKHCIHKLRLIGYVDIVNLSKKTFEDRLKWVIYITKNWSYTKSVLDLKDPIICFKNVN